MCMSLNKINILVKEGPYVDDKMKYSTFGGKIQNIFETEWRVQSFTFQR